MFITSSFIERDTIKPLLFALSLSKYSFAFNIKYFPFEKKSAFFLESEFGSIKDFGIEKRNYDIIPFLLLGIGYNLNISKNITLGNSIRYGFNFMKNDTNKGYPILSANVLNLIVKIDR